MELHDEFVIVGRDLEARAESHMSGAILEGRRYVEPRLDIGHWRKRLTGNTRSAAATAGLAPCLADGLRDAAPETARVAGRFARCCHDRPSRGHGRCLARELVDHRFQLLDARRARPRARLPP